MKLLLAIIIFLKVLSKLLLNGIGMDVKKVKNSDGVADIFMKNYTKLEII